MAKIKKKDLEKPMTQEDESDNSYKKLPKQTREFSGFLYLVIDAALGSFPDTIVETDIRCFKKGCHGMINTEYDYIMDEIRWHCTSCVNGGNITHISGSERDDDGL